MKAIGLGFVLSSVLLAGCGSMPNPMRPEKASASALSDGKGLVIISTGAPDKCVSQATHLNVMQANPVKGVLTVPVDAYVFPSDFTDHYGFLNVVTLAPGDYFLYATILNPYVHPINVQKADFTIHAGEVLYLGEYYQAVSCVLNPVAEFRDQRSRDMALMEQKNPEIAKLNVSTHILKFTGYAVGGPK